MPRPSSRPLGDLVLFVFALFLAFVVWVIVRQQEIVTRTIMVPVRYKFPEYIAVRNETKSLAVTFSLAKVDARLARNLENFGIQVDENSLSKPITDGTEFREYRIPLKTNQLKFPATMTFVGFDDNPEAVIEAKLLLVKARVKPSIALADVKPGREVLLEQVRVDPVFVDVGVTPTRYRDAQTNPVEIETAPIDVATRTESFTGKYGISYSDTEGVFFIKDISASTVEVTVPLQEMRRAQTFKNIPVRYSAVKYGLQTQVVPSAVDVTVEGPVSLIDRLLSETIRLSPRMSALLDEAHAGEAIETSVEITFDTTEPRFARELKTTLNPSRVTVKFEDIPNLPEAVPAGPTPVPTQASPWNLPSSTITISPTPSAADGATTSTAGRGNTGEKRESR